VFYELLTSLHFLELITDKHTVSRSFSFQFSVARTLSCRFWFDWPSLTHQLDVHWVYIARWRLKTQRCLEESLTKQDQSPIQLTDL